MAQAVHHRITSRLQTLRGLLVRLGIAALAVAIVSAAFSADSGRQAKDLLRSSPAGTALAVVAWVYGLFVIVINVIRLVLVLRYRPTPLAADDALPAITVVVPAYNEGEHVYHTLCSLAASDYPADKMQLIAVDDGSVDDTWRHIARAADELGCVQTVRMRRNRGKRHALYEGFRRGQGDVFVTVDSDSLVEPHTLRSLVSPMVANPSIGAVAGNVRVLNRDAGILPRLLSVSFVFAFDFVRSAESELGAVLCTPGALSAYRADCLRAVMDEWLNQTYGSRPAAIGEDRALTNMILRRGHKVTFQSSAKVFTTVPTAFAGLRKMFTRWARSDVRESIAFARFGFRPFAGLTGWTLFLARLNFIAKTAAITLGWPMLAAALILAACFPAVIGLKLLAGTVFGSLWSMGICLLRGRKRDALYALPYAWLWLVALWWITPYGLFTSSHGGWLTRGKPARRTRDVTAPLPIPAAAPAAAAPMAMLLSLTPQPKHPAA